MDKNATTYPVVDPIELQALLVAAPESPMTKLGKKGETRFYLAPRTLATRRYSPPQAGLTNLEMLAPRSQSVAE